MYIIYCDCNRLNEKYINFTSFLQDQESVNSYTFFFTAFFQLHLKPFTWSPYYSTCGWDKVSLISQLPCFSLNLFDLRAFIRATVISYIKYKTSLCFLHCLAGA